MRLLESARRFWDRLNKRQRFVILQLLLFAIAIFPLGLYRLSLGQYGHALFDAVLLFVFASLVWLALIDRFLDLATRIMSFAYVGGVFGVVALMGQVGLFWAFVAGLGSFFAVRSIEAIWICALIYALVLGEDFGGADYPTIVTFSACFTLVSAFGYYFASRLWVENEKLGLEVHLDVLTRLKNRRAFDDDLARLIETECPPEGGCSMIVADIDHFKHINDAYGHDAGDRMLAGVARALHATLPEGTSLYRFGGEEFVILCRFPHDAAGIAEALREAVAGAELLRLGDRSITISLGVARRRQEDDARSWFQRADAALYQAKKTGRNRVVKG